MGVRANSRRLLLFLLIPFFVYEYMYFSMQFPGTIDSWVSGKTLTDAREYLTTRVGRPKAASYEGKGYDPADWIPTEDSVKFSFPQRDLRQFKSFPAHNLYTGEGNAFATVFTSRNSSLSDPYFAATLSQIYRLLWSQHSASETIPFVVFVPPYISRIQREMFMGAGALVREIEPLSVKPTRPTSARYRDGFTKLNLWKETGFKRIAYLDADVFPMANVDALLTGVTPSRCKMEKLGEADMKDDVSMCDYAFAADFGEDGSMSTSVMVLEPNEHMHRRLLRDMQQTALYDTTRMDNAYLEWAFATEGPFPADPLPQGFHAQSPSGVKEERLVHLKLWRVEKLKEQFYAKNWIQEWIDMIEFFDGEKYPAMRDKDVVVAERAQEQLLKNEKYKNSQESSASKLELGDWARYDYDADSGDERMSGADIRAALRQAEQLRQKPGSGADGDDDPELAAMRNAPIAKAGSIKVVGDD